jgi:DNA-binding response OmpR family regulator
MPDNVLREPVIVKTGHLTINLTLKTVWVGENQVALTPKEYDLLAILAENQGELVPNPGIMDILYPGDESPEEQMPKVLVCKIRKKLGPYGPHYIETVWGKGYRLTKLTVEDLPPLDE